MFTQPMLLKAELKQYPISYCIVQADKPARDLETADWQRELDILMSALVLGAKVPAAKVQHSIIEIRATNWLAGWECLEAMRPYQVVSAIVLMPLLPKTRSAKDVDSLSDYLDICLQAAILGGSLKDAVNYDCETMYIKKAMALELSNPESKIVTRALKKIANADIIEEIKADNMPKAVIQSMMGQIHAPVHCSECEMEDASKLQRCSKCRVRIYCSPKCQKAHWTSKHKEECSRFAAVTSYRIPTALAARLDAIAASS